MATYIFGGLTAAVLALSIWMGFKNNNEFEKQVKLNKRAESTLNSLRVDLSNLKTKRDDTVASKKAATEENVKETANLEALVKDVASIESDISEKENIKKANDKQIATNVDVLKGLPDPDVLVPQITATKNKIAQLKTDIESDESSLTDLKESSDKIIALAARKRVVAECQAAGKSLPSLSTSVQSVYRNWGFVTLSGGNAQGVVSSSILDVLRNGEVVAKLKVTAVEQNRAAADIIPGALPVTISLRSGDRVVAEKIAQQ
ncbi:hypothetical protein [Rubritalea profundi]|uniref:Uncharacterized protein n=1 Tax=Rubritalea profundi TaxID=1658618 RepID=A0A2S7U3A4_9BACT|nr:hypothetical protein [Rubritalea profundi]PQJ28921.1 hypothetical protein BSZ32_10755 [Rubritalea profundi]